MKRKKLIIEGRSEPPKQPGYGSIHLVEPGEKTPVCQRSTFYAMATMRRGPFLEAKESGKKCCKMCMRFLGVWEYPRKGKWGNRPAQQETPGQ